MTKHRVDGKRIIFYLPYSFGDLNSGSRVRPYKMYNAFLKLGYTVDLIAGTPKERIAKYKEVLSARKNYSFCYAEASPYPLNPVYDYRILLGIRRLGIPIGIYYRDAYWKFKDYFHFKGLKRIELLFRYQLDMFLFSRTASVMFFPTNSLLKIIKFTNSKIVLPPAGEHSPIKREFKLPLKAVYVGGITYRYGIKIMLQALALVNRDKLRFNLELVCRKREFEVLPKDIQRMAQVPWIKVSHVSGDTLKEVYSRSHIALIPLIKDSYNDLAFPVKLFEYLSFGLPIVATNCNEMSNFIEANECGIVCKDDGQSLANALNLLSNDIDKLKQLSCQAERTITNGNLWEDRVKLVARVLEGLGSS